MRALSLSVSARLAFREYAPVFPDFFHGFGPGDGYDVGGGKDVSQGGPASSITPPEKGFMVSTPTSLALQEEKSSIPPRAPRNCSRS